MREFKSMGALALHLIAAEAAVQLAGHHGLKQAAKLIEKTAKDEIGHYQPDVGPFPAWAPLAESTEAQKAAKGYPSNAPLLASGAMRDHITHEISGHEAVVGSPDDRAVYHEFGTSKMPPRPVFGPAVFSNKKKIEHLIGVAVIHGIIDGKVTTGGGDYFLGH